MISGPTIPNTLQSLRELLVQRADLIEHGMAVVAEDLVLGHDAAVDILACDATGAPVFAFIAVPETAAGLTARALGVHRWWRQNASCLAREISAPELGIDRDPRFLVIGLDILADTLEELRRTQLEGLSVAQLCSFTLGGRLRLGLTMLYESTATAVPSALDAFVVPPGILDPRQRALAARFMDLARRVDLGMTARGDRFSRQLLLHGRYIAQLGLAHGELTVEFPALAVGFAKDCPIPAQTFELDDATCLSAIDRMLRLVLAIEIGAAGDVPAPAAVREPGNGTAPPVRTAAAVTASAAVPPVPEDRFSLEPIRRSVARAQLSREEFSALGDEGSDS